jgi:hypothetical protein
MLEAEIGYPASEKAISRIDLEGTPNAHLHKSRN